MGAKAIKLGSCDKHPAYCILYEIVLHYTPENATLQVQSAIKATYEGFILRHQFIVISHVLMRSSNLLEPFHKKNAL